MFSRPGLPASFFLKSTSGSRSCFHHGPLSVCWRPSKPFGYQEQNAITCLRRIKKITSSINQSSRLQVNICHLSLASSPFSLPKQTSEIVQNGRTSHLEQTILGVTFLHVFSSRGFPLPRQFLRLRRDISSLEQSNHGGHVGCLQPEAFIGAIASGIEIYSEETPGRS